MGFKRGSPICESELQKVRMAASQLRPIAGKDNRQGEQCELAERLGLGASAVKDKAEVLETPAAPYSAIVWLHGPSYAQCEPNAFGGHRRDDTSGVRHTMSRNQLLCSALGYGVRGWRVFPVHSPTGPRCSCGKSNCEAIGKHSRVKAWPTIATTNETTIRCWWEKWPDANIGIATGAESCLLVLDVDNKGGKDGNATLAELCDRYTWKAETFTIRTASGHHLYFEHPGGSLSGGTCALGPGLDVQGDGKCVITAPSLHQSGCQYQCEDPKAPVARLPESILALIRPAHRPDQQRILEGQRNLELTRIAGRERRKGATESELAEIVLAENQRRCVTPLPRSEALRIAQSVARYDPAEANLYWMPLVISDWDGSLIVKSGSSSERGMYASLIVESWRRRGVLPDDAQLWRLAQADSQAQFQEARVSCFPSSNPEAQMAGRYSCIPDLLNCGHNRRKSTRRKSKQGERAGKNGALAREKLVRSQAVEQQANESATDVQRTLRE
jgi:Bifunctional DNA primase/polymerase, N-terminal/Primase C terminal 1 (PriCT-1)